MALSLATHTEMLRIFLSSGTDASRLRERMKALIEDVFNPQFMELGLATRFECAMWERSVAHRVTTGNSNDKFVALARGSVLTVVLLLNELRPGTREELDAVLEDPNIELAVLQFGEELSADAQSYLELHQNDFLYKRVSDVESDIAWHELIRVLLNLALRATGRPLEEVYYDAP